MELQLKDLQMIPNNTDDFPVTNVIKKANAWKFVGFQLFLLQCRYFVAAQNMVWLSKRCKRYKGTRTTANASHLFLFYKPSWKMSCLDIFGA